MDVILRERSKRLLRAEAVPPERRGGFAERCLENVLGGPFVHEAGRVKALAPLPNAASAVGLLMLKSWPLKSVASK
jgi:hypothetical protein